MLTPEELMNNIDALMAKGAGHVNVIAGEAKEGEGITSIDTHGCLECENSPVPMACGVPTVFTEHEGE